ncbi:hypothetical protein A2U01_0109811, partial [Trifolium medium]|nr:hypothetical protein [Trifolium medium]
MTQSLSSSLSLESKSLGATENPQSSE